MPVDPMVEVYNQRYEDSLESSLKLFFDWLVKEFELSQEEHDNFYHLVERYTNDNPRAD